MRVMKKMHIGHKKDRNCIQKCGEDASRQKKVQKMTGMMVRTRSGQKMVMAYGVNKGKRIDR